MKEYREKNKEKLKTYSKIYSEINKERIKEVCKKYYEENKEKVYAKSTEWKNKNKEKTKEYAKKNYNKRKLKDFKKIMGVMQLEIKRINSKVIRVSLNRKKYQSSETSGLFFLEDDIYKIESTKRNINLFFEFKGKNKDKGFDEVEKYVGILLRKNYVDLNYKKCEARLLKKMQEE